MTQKQKVMILFGVTLFLMSWSKFPVNKKIKKTNIPSVPALPALVTKTNAEDKKTDYLQKTKKANYKSILGAL